MPANQRPPALAPLFRKWIAGEVLDDPAAIDAYSRDASPYCHRPSLVIRPRDRADVAAIVAESRRHGIPVIPRAGGTSLAGQCVPVGDSIVIDLAAWMDGIVRLDVAARRATVQPGIVRDVLNRHLAPHGLMFGPDPSTTDRCQIGGMIGNNAWGLHAVSRGTTRDHVVALDVVLADGGYCHLRGIDDTTPAALREAFGDGAGRHAAVLDIVGRHANAIDRGYPSLRGVTNNAGYPLDVLRRQQPFVADGRAFSLAPLLCGAEGTLAIVVEATVDLMPLPRNVTLCCLQFDSIDAALRAVEPVHASAPTALELLDRAILRVADGHPEHRHHRSWLTGDPAAVLLVEYAGDDAVAIRQHVERLMRWHAGAATMVDDAAAIERVWALRRASLAMLMGAAGGLRAVTGIEDAAVARRDLPAFYAAVAERLRRDHMAHFAYGPVGMGSLHIRPELPLDGHDALSRYERLLDDVAAIAVAFGGTFTCKHGDGRMRGRYLDAVLGADVVRALREVKQAFDPDGLLNPGKVLDCPPFATDLLAAGA